MSFPTPDTEAMIAAFNKPLDKITIPLLRRTFPKLIAKELVSVQPMTAPAFGESIAKLYPEPEPIEFFSEEEFNI